MAPPPGPGHRLSLEETLGSGDGRVDGVQGSRA